MVTIFGVDPIMDRLAQKLETELQSGSYVISNIFRFTKWKPVDMKNDLWLYEIRPKVTDATNPTQSTTIIKD